MIRILRRGLSFLLVIWLAVTIAFFGLRILPGDAIQARLIESGAGEAIIQQRRDDQGLNDPLAVQYIRYLSELVQGKLGYSLVDGQSVSEMIIQQVPPTASLAIGAIVFASVMGILFGIVVAQDSRSVFTVVARIAIHVSLSTPLYWTGTLAITIFSVQLGLLPSTGAGRLSQLILPVSVLGFHTSGAIARLVETRIREVKVSDFVRTARAKGLSEAYIMRLHILRVGLVPVLTVILLQAGFLFSGTVITERLFVRPGIGMLLVDRTLQQDYPAVQGIVIFVAVIYTILNVIGDLLYPLIDPRMAHQ
jgi:ABC-type dipeptide/oligopeptide/nickel transport system permease component